MTPVEATTASTQAVTAPAEAATASVEAEIALRSCNSSKRSVVAPVS